MKWIEATLKVPATVWIKRRSDWPRELSYVKREKDSVPFFEGSEFERT